MYNCLYPDASGLVGLLVAWALASWLVGRKSQSVDRYVDTGCHVNTVVGTPHPPIMYMYVYTDKDHRDSIIQVYPANMNFWRSILAPDSFHAIINNTLLNIYRGK